MTTRRTTWRRSAAALTAALAAATTAAACSGVGGNDSSEGTGTPGFDPDCVTVDMAVSPEKVTLLTDLAETFNESDAEVGGQCVSVRVTRKSSGAAATLLTQDWPNPETNGPRPVIWSPAASGWAAIVNEEVGRTLAPAGRPFMQTPLVIAMPQPMAEALGYPETPIGFTDIGLIAPGAWADFTAVDCGSLPGAARDAESVAEAVLQTGPDAVVATWVAGREVYRA